MKQVYNANKLNRKTINVQNLYNLTHFSQLNKGLAQDIKGRAFLFGKGRQVLGALFFVATLFFGVFGGESWGQNVSATWGANSNSAWYTVGNWSGNFFAGIKAVATSNTNIATFTSSYTGTTVGINMGTSSLSLGAISIDNTRTTSLNIGNSSGTGGTLALYGATVNSVANTILRNNGTGLLTLQAAQNGAMGVVLSNSTNNIINTDGSGGIAISSIISGGSNSLTLSGANTLTLSGANTYTGSTTISSGTLALTGGSTASSNIIVGSGATFDVSSFGGLTLTANAQALSSSATGSNTTGTIKLASSNGITLSTGASGGLNFTGLASNATPPLTLSGSGTLVLNGAQVTVPSSLAVGTYTLIAKGGTATVTGSLGSLNYNGSGNNTTGVLQLNSSQLQLVVSVNYYWNGSNNGAYTHTWDAPSNYWTTPTATATPNAAWTDGSSNIANFLNTGGGTVTISANRTYSQINITNTSSTPHIFSTAYGGGTGNVLTGPIALTANSALQMPVDNSLTNDATLDIAGSITGASGSFLNIRNNTATAANSSRVNLTSANAVVSVPTINITGSGTTQAGFVAKNTGISISSNIVNNSTANTMLASTNGNDLTVTGNITGNGGLWIAAGQNGGSGNLTLTPSTGNTYSGATYFNGTVGNGTTTGLVKLGNVNGISSSSDIVMGASSGNGQTLDLNGFSPTFQSLASVSGGTGNITNNSTTSNSTLTINQASNKTFGLVINDGGSKTVSLTKSGAGTLTLSGANTYSGGLTVNAGYISGATETNMFGASSAITLNGGGINPTTNINLNTTGRTINLGSLGGYFDATGVTLTHTNAMTGSAGSTFYAVGGTNKMAATNVIPSASAVSMTNAASNILDLNGFNQTIAALSGGGASGGNITLGLGSATLTINGSGTTNYAGVISQTGALTTQGTTNLTLSGTNTYTGATTISTGTTLNVTGSLASGSTVTVNSGGTLSGTGTVNGAVTENGTISPAGAGSIGTLTTGNLTLGPGGTYYVDLNNITGTPGTNWDKIVAGTLTNSATSGSKFTISMNGTITGFPSGGNISWIIGTYTGSTPLTSNIQFTATGSLASYTSNLSLSFAGNNITVTFTPTAPVLTTTAAASITSTGATLAGNVTSNGGANITVDGIAYALYSQNTNPTIGGTGCTNTAGTTVQSGAFSISPTLSVNTQYAYNAYATNSINTTYGIATSFWTLANTPTAPIVVGSTSTNTVTVTIGSGDGNPNTTLYAIYCSTTSKYVQGSGSLGASAVYQTAATWATQTVTGLSAGTAYTFYTVAQNGGGTVTSSSPTVTVYTLSTIPTGNPASFTSAAGSSTSINLTFSSASSVSASGYLIIQNNGGTGATFTPTNGTAYTIVGAACGTGTLAININSSATNIATINSLTAGTQYTYTIIPYTWDGSHAGTYDYYTTSNPTTTTTTLVATPTAASSVTTTSVTSTTLTVNWTNGNGSGRIVVARLTSTTAVAPTGGTSYTPSAAGSFIGSTITGTGNIVVYNGTGNTIGITGLSSNTAYTFDVYEYNGSMPTINYASASSASATTPCGTSTLPFSEDFENNGSLIPNCWSTAQISAGSYTAPAIKSVTRGTSAHPSALSPNSGSYSGEFNSYNSNGSIRLQSPVIDASSASNLVLTFYWYTDASDAGADNVQVQYSTNGGSIWTNYGSSIARYNTSYQGWVLETINLPAGANSANLQIGFLFTGTYSSTNCHLDNINLYNCSTGTLPFSEYFQHSGNAPNCWSSNVVTTGGSHSAPALSYPSSGTLDGSTTVSAYSSYPYDVEFNSYSASSGNQIRLQSPVINASSASALQVTFQWYQDAGRSTANDGVTVQYSTNGTTYTSVGSLIPRYNATTTGWQTKTVNLPAGAITSTLQLGFLFTSAYGNNCHLNYINLYSSPTVTTSAATSISTTRATLGGSISSTGGTAITADGVVYATTSNNSNPQIGGSNVTNTTATTVQSGAFSIAPSSLSVNTQYSYNAYATNSFATSYGAVGTFYTLCNTPSAPTVNGATVSSLNVTINANGNPSTTLYAIQENVANSGTPLYVQSNGTLGASAYYQTASSWNGANSYTTVSGLAANTGYGFSVSAQNGTGINTAFGSNAATTNTLSAAVPTISTFGTGSITAVSTTYGTATATPTSFSISGSALTAGITVTPPTGFEVSTSSTFVSNVGNNSSPITIGSGGTITSTTIYLRLAATATVAGSPYSGNILLSSNGTTSNVATVSSTVSPYTLTISGLSGVNKTYDGTTSATLTGTATLSARVNSDVITLGGSPTATYVSANAGVENITILGYTISGTNATSYTLTQPSASATINQKTVTVTSAAATNKTYDGTNAATITGSLNGVIAADVSNVTFNGTGTFAQAGIGSGISVTSTSTLSGSAAANYTLTQPTGLIANIIAKSVSITSPVASSKTYDGSNAATISGILNGVIAADNGNVSLSGTGTFAQTGVGTGIAVTSTSTLTGSAAGNYTLTQPTGLTANITGKSVTISGASATSKTYDATNVATITGTLSGVLAADVSNVTLNLTGTFAQTSIGTGISVTSTSTLTGSAAGNYTLTQPTGLTANITTKTVTITGAVANNKPYDGTVAATISGTLNGVIAADASNVGLNGTGTFGQTGVGTGLVVTSTSTLTGSAAGNYTLTQPTGLTANITQASQTITFTLSPSSYTTYTSTFVVSATASSGLSVSFSSDNPLVATVSGTTVTIVGVGTANIIASQAGNGNYTAAANVQHQLTVTPAPVISTSVSTLGTFNNTTGTASTAQAFTVNGTNLSANITVTPPSGYEVSVTSATSGFGSSQTITQSSGTASGTVWVRIAAATAAGSYSGNVTLTSTTATTNVAVSGTVYASTQTIADWTFETSQPTTAGPFSPESGTQTATAQASCHHTSGSVNYTNAAGNGSTYSFSSNYWSVGDYYQFKVSTSGLSNINFTWDQTGSNTGPADFKVQYSTDGSTFSNVPSSITNYTYTITNDSWNTSSTKSQSTRTINLSTITALNNVSNVYIRLTMADGNAISGSLGTAGTDRVDNVIVTGTPATSYISVGGGPITSLSTTYGTTSTSTSFTLTGNNLSSTITSSALNGFEFSTDNTNFYTTLTGANAIPTAGGTVYVRLAATTVAGSSYGGTVTFTSGSNTATATIPTSVVNKAPLTVTTNNQSVCYGTAVATVQNNGSYTATGFVNNETVSMLTGTASYATNYTNSSVAGTAGLTILVSGLSATNYNFTPTAGTVTVNGDNTAGLPSSTPTLCINSTLTNITISTSGATGIGIATGLPTGVTASWGSNTITISGTPTVSGTFNYSIPLTGGCGSVYATGTITVTATNTISLASAVATTSQSVCQNSTITNIAYNTTSATGATFSGLPSGLTTGWSGNVATISGSPTASGTFNYTVTTTGGCGTASLNGTITVLSSGTWAGSSTAWATPGNWCGGVPNSSTNAFIPAGYVSPSIVGTSYVNNLTIASGASLTVSGTLQIGGTITNSGTLDATAGTIVLNGTTAQTLPATFSSSNTIGTLIASNTAGVTLGGNVNITNFLHITSGNLNLSNYDITLKSTATTSGQLGTVAGTITYGGTGRFISETYINTTRRGYRNIGSGGILSDGSIFSNWQEGGSNVAGYGTQITGSVGYSSGYNSTTGLDYTKTGNPSLFTYNTSDAFVKVTNTMSPSTNGLLPFVGYYALLRGDRTYDLFSNSPSLYVANTTLRVKGKATTGTVTLSSNADPVCTVDGQSVSSSFRLNANKTPTGQDHNNYGFSLVANPYPCAIDWASVYTRSVGASYSNGHISPYHWIWNQAINNNAGGWVTVKNDGVVSVLPSASLNYNSRYIQPGQSFYIWNDNSGNDLKVEFQEADKYVTDATQVKKNFSTTVIPNYLRVNLVRSDSSELVTADGLVASFDASYNNDVDVFDAGKFSNNNENIAIQRGSSQLSIECRKTAIAIDSLPLTVWNLVNGKTYSIQVSTANYNAGLQPYLHDNLLGSYTAIPLDSNIIYTFTNTADTNTYKHRFSVRFGNAITLPVTFTHITAQPGVKGNDIEWEIGGKNVGNITFGIERSNDGKGFVNIGTVNGSNKTFYPYEDYAPLNGVNYYRVKATIDGQAAVYSQTVSVAPQSSLSSITLQGNLVEDRQIEFAFNNVAKGNYQVALYSTDGKKLSQFTIIHDGNNGNKKAILTNSTITKGIYLLQVNNDKLNYLSEKIIVR